MDIGGIVDYSGVVTSGFIIMGIVDMIGITGEVVGASVDGVGPALLLLVVLSYHTILILVKEKRL